ncbi:solute carrier family 35 member E1 homolog [Venturia canescens]|uniref:solute carrier family 35 member E1 homolog n=1 Tax=Venturia canescens TaxID=32260 RepID=UPI001C9CDCD8|nr:solute carrier family 35 member E1 homolog [Venturia canescens]
MENKTEQSEEVIVKVPLQDEVQEKEEPQNPWKISFFCFIWFVASICNAFLIKIVMNERRILSVTTALMVQLVSTLLYTWIFTTLWGVPKNNTQVSLVKYLKLTFPIAVSIFLRTRIRDWEIWSTPISDPVTIPVEAAYLFFALVFSKTILGDKRIEYWHMSLVAVAAWAIISFCGFNSLRVPEILGFAVMTAFEMAFSKMIMREFRIHPLRLLSALSALVLLPVLAMWIYEMSWRIQYTDILERPMASQTVLLIFLFGILSCIQSAAAFTILSAVPFHHYLIGSAFNRITRFCSIALITSAFPIVHQYYNYQF